MFNCSCHHQLLIPPDDDDPPISSFITVNSELYQVLSLSWAVCTMCVHCSISWSEADNAHIGSCLFWRLFKEESSLSYGVALLFVRLYIACHQAKTFPAKSLATSVDAIAPKSESINRSVQLNWLISDNSVAGMPDTCETQCAFNAFWGSISHHQQQRHFHREFTWRRQRLARTAGLQESATYHENVPPIVCFKEASKRRPPSTGYWSSRHVSVYQCAFSSPGNAQ